MCLVNVVEVDCSLSFNSSQVPARANFSGFTSQVSDYKAHENEVGDEENQVSKRPEVEGGLVDQVASSDVEAEVENEGSVLEEAPLVQELYSLRSIFHIGIQLRWSLESKRSLRSLLNNALMFNLTSVSVVETSPGNELHNNFKQPEGSSKSATIRPFDKVHLVLR